MKDYTFQKLRRRYVRFDEKRFLIRREEVFGPNGKDHPLYDWYSPPSHMWDAWVQWSEDVED